MTASPALLISRALLGASLTCAAVLAQTPGATEDPYTEGRREALERLGYRSLGPFSWGRNFGTDHIDRTLGTADMRWVETEHFKIGCNLGLRLVRGETRHRRRITEELTELGKKLPNVEPRSRKLDRWLLLHLYAQRLEALYADFSRLLGVDEIDFPTNDGRSTPGTYMGRGPHLGQKGKFCVILFDRRTQLQRYLRAIARIEGKEPAPCRHPIPDAGSLAFVTASECFSGQLFDESNMHSHVIGEVVKNLCDGYKSSLVTLPPWCLEGLSHWFRRKIDPRINLIDETADPAEAAWGEWEWPAKVRARVKHDYFPRATSLMAATSAGDWRLQSHMMSWSRVDFLLARDRAGMRRFLDALKDRPIPWERLKEERRLEWQAAALRKAWGLDLDAFDAEWRKFVLDVYPR